MLILRKTCNNTRQILCLVLPIAIYHHIRICDRLHQHVRLSIAGVSCCVIDSRLLLLHTVKQMHLLSTVIRMQRQNKQIHVWCTTPDTSSPVQCRCIYIKALSNNRWLLCIQIWLCKRTSSRREGSSSSSEPSCTPCCDRLASLASTRRSMAKARCKPLMPLVAGREST